MKVGDKEMRNKMRKILAITIAIIIALSISAPVLAGGGVDVNVEVSEITVDGNGVPDSPVTASGTVTITSKAFASGLIAYADAESEASYEVTSPSGVIASGSNSEKDSDWATDYYPASADASQVYSWEVTVTHSGAGVYNFSHSGEACAAWLSFLPDGSGYDHASATASASYRVEVTNHSLTLRIILPDAAASFDRTGSALSKAVDFNDGTWRVEIPQGTKILSPSGNDALYLCVNSNGEITSEVKFVGGEAIITRM